VKPRQWFRFDNAAADPSVVHIHVIDIIGDWIDELINEFYGMKATLTAKAFVDQLAKLPEAVTAIKVHINSPGGDVFAAINIANALREQQTSKGRSVETIVDGLAASAASIIMMAGKTVTIADNAMVMIHNPWTVAMGAAGDMRKAADTLDAIRNTIVATYKWHSEMKDADLVALMDAETWMDADEALANGFATAKIDGLTAAASIDARAGAQMMVPEKFRARVEALLKKETPPTPAPQAAAAAEVLAAVAAAGLGVDFARDLVAAGLPMEQVTARVTTAKSEKATREARATDIRGLCAAAKLPECADGYINGGIAVADVRTHLTTITARMDKAVIDTNLNPDAGQGRAKATLSTTDIYAERNRPSAKE
jgi:ATP-dependent protease ClpP protease subunit